MAVGEAVLSTDLLKSRKGCWSSTPYFLLLLFLPITIPISASQLILYFVRRIDTFQKVNDRIKHFISGGVVLVQPSPVNLVFLGPIHRIGERSVFDNKLHKA